MRLGPPATFCHSPFHIIQKCTAPIKKYLRFCSLMLPTYTDNKALSGERWSCCHCWVSSCVPYCGLWCPCVGEMNVLACSYHCWFPGRLNGRCSGAVRMNGWPLSSHDNLLPTALILHRGHWSASYWFFLFLSFLLFPPLYICLSLSQICLPWPRRSSWRRWPVTTATSNMAGQTERMATTTQGWVSPVHTHAVSAWHVWLQSYNALRGCCLYVNTTWAAVFMCGCRTKLIETRMWHHLCCLYVSSERLLMKNKLQQQWVSSSEGVRRRHLGQVIQTIKTQGAGFWYIYIFLSTVFSRSW